MTHLIAQLPTATAEQLGLWITCAAAVAMAFGYLRSVFTRKPPIEAEFVTKQEFERFKDKVEANFSDLQLTIQREMKELNKTLDDRAVQLHNRINPLEKLLGRIEATLEAIRETN